MKSSKPKITLRRVDDPVNPIGQGAPQYRVEKIINEVVVEYTATGVNGHSQRKNLRVGEVIDEVLADQLTAKNEVTTLAPAS